MTINSPIKLVLMTALRYFKSTSSSFAPKSKPLHSIFCTRILWGVFHHLSESVTEFGSLESEYLYSQNIPSEEAIFLGYSLSCARAEAIDVAARTNPNRAVFVSIVLSPSSRTLVFYAITFMSASKARDAILHPIKRVL